MATDTERVMTVEELAAYLKIHRSTIYRLLTNEGLPGFKIGSDWRFKVADIDEWIAARKKSSLAKK
jgi:excisionase family DNA binding protein